MRRQRNMAQMKGQIKTPEREVNKIETSILPEFNTLVIRVLSELSIKKGMEIIKKNQSDIKDTLK